MPDMSVTIRPSGRAYRVAREIIDALSGQCLARAAGASACNDNRCGDFEPHVTIQYVYEVPRADVDSVAAALDGFFRAEPWFEICFGELGTFPNVPGVHVDLDRTSELVHLYARTKEVLEALGQRTYPYDAATWAPHLSLSCRHWSPDEVEQIRRMFPRLDLGFAAERVQINRLEQRDCERQRWVVLRDVPLLGAGAPIAPRPDAAPAPDVRGHPPAAG